ncbi:MAG: hypothetical protein ACK5NN_03320 [Sphingomonadaceae bacterium]
MDTLRGYFGSGSNSDDRDDYDFLEDETGHELPPRPVGQDERRMQVRAYNHWASLLHDRTFPSIEDLEPETLPDFGPYSVVLDFSTGVEDPAIQYVGESLAHECDTNTKITRLSDVPSRSLLSRITDHYMQILANQAPIGFEAEFVNQREVTILYRGILLPFSSDNETIDFIYGVINWKELADQITTDELLLEIDQALDQSSPSVSDKKRLTDPVTDWADGPGAANDQDLVPAVHFPEQRYGMTNVDSGHDDWDDEDDEQEPQFGSLLSDGLSGKSSRAPLTVNRHQSLNRPLGLHDCLAQARELALAARSSEDRTRSALYEAVGLAYDVSLAAEEAPADFAELVAENGLTVQERAPMTPVVKLVFGGDYDKTRLTEYAAVLSHGHRMSIERGQMAEFLRNAEGGLKGVVRIERQLRREESGKPVVEQKTPEEKLAKKLRAITPGDLSSLDTSGPEFGLVMIRRLDDGSIGILGELEENNAMLEKAARTLIERPETERPETK